MTDPFLQASPTYIEAHRPRPGLRIKTSGGFEWQPNDRWTIARWLRCMAPALIVLAVLVAYAWWS